MNWYNIKNSSNNSTDVVIYDEIGTWGVDSKTFINEIKNISTDNVTLRINSPGGSVIDGLSIHDAIKRMPQKVTARVEGLAASIASIIALGADEVSMSENSLFMIHNVWGGETGGAEDMRKAADLMDKMSDRLVNVGLMQMKLLKLDSLTILTSLLLWQLNLILKNSTIRINLL